MKEWYQMREDEVLEALGSDANGLSSEKAEALLKTHGENVLRETKKKSVWRVFAEQFADLLVIILIIAAIRLSMISSKSPFIISPSLYNVSLIRCSVQRPCGKL